LKCLRYEQTQALKSKTKRWLWHAGGSKSLILTGSPAFDQNRFGWFVLASYVLDIRMQVTRPIADENRAPSDVAESSNRGYCSLYRRQDASASGLAIRPSLWVCGTTPLCNSKLGLKGFSTATRMVALARKLCHVLCVLACLTAVFLSVRCGTATGRVCAFLLFGHSSLSSDCCS
jgi:hypothetical protein